MKNLKILIITVLLGYSHVASSQDDSGGSDQKVRFGIALNSGASWLKLEKDQENDGLGFVIGGGLVMEFRVSDYVALTTGVTMSNYAANVKYTTDLNFTYEREEDGAVLPPETSLLLGRKYFFKTVELPLKLKLKTPEIGYLTYFAELGLVGCINYKSYSKENTISESGTTKVLSGSLDEIDANQVTNWFRGALSMNVGIEYSLIGNTALVVNLTWDYALSNILRDDDLNKTKLSFANNPETVFKQKGFLNYGGVKAALMF
jgi:hypothetical protein